MNTTEFNPERLALEYNAKSPPAIIRLALEHFEDAAISFSGAEDVVLIDMACRIKPDVHVFSLDTGRLHPETYRFIEQVRNHYALDIDILSPDADRVRELARHKGLYSFYKDGHQECCAIRKVMPLRQKLGALSAWMTGQRKDQSPGTRAAVPVIERDQAFSSEDRTLIKFNPLANWRSAEVWEYIRANDVPYNSLHERGYASIGCEPCTRPILPGQHEREGRWWWEQASRKECGLHRRPSKSR